VEAHDTPEQKRGRGRPKGSKNRKLYEPKRPYVSIFHLDVPAEELDVPAPDPKKKYRPWWKPELGG
jgi:hypothetical protein